MPASRSSPSPPSRVAVKRLSGDGATGAGNREFLAELEVLGSLSHPNLARLLGYCTAVHDRIFVYDLLERGSLDALLHGRDAEAACGGGGDGTAAALAFLHHGRQPPVLHNDVKSSKVLLSEGFEAKPADFVLARIAMGSPAKYVEPEIWAGVGATAKVVKIGEKEVDMVDWAREKIGAGQASEILDRRMGIGAKGKEMDEVKALLEIVWLCTDSGHKNRPMMEEVVTMLNKI